MATHNHAMFAGACSFIVEDLFGLVASRDAYRTVTLRPRMATSVGYFSFALHTVRGEYRMTYRREEEGLRLSLCVPFGCTACLTMPDGAEYRLEGGEHTLFARLAGEKALKKRGGEGK